MASYPVLLYMYDLSGGLAAQLSPLLLGRRVDAIWHTSVVVHGREYYFGQGVSWSAPGRTHFGAPLRKLQLGTTTVDADSVAAWVAAANAGDFSAARYSLLEFNCNHFSAAFSEFLTGFSNLVPRDVVDQASIILNTPFGAALAPALGGLEAALRVRETADEPSTASLDRAEAAVEAAVAATALADAAAAASPPATAAITPLAAQEAAVGADVAAGAADARREFEALVKAEFDAVVATGLAPNAAATLALERATAAVRRGRVAG